MDAARTPVLVGLAQRTWRHEDEDPRTWPSPLDALERVAREAAEDAHGAQKLLDAIDQIGVIDAPAWNPRNAAQLLAERLGAKPCREVVTRIGGELALTLANDFAGRILAGRARVALVAGTNHLHSTRKASAQAFWMNWPNGAANDPEPEWFGSERPGSNAIEIVHGCAAPAHVYPVFENALRARRGLDLDTHMRNLGALMSPFTRVAAHNPHAWFPVERSGEELVTPSASNRMVAYPYTKYLNAVIATDQTAGVLLCSVEAARELGIPEDRWLYWWGGASARERAWFTSERPAFDHSPAMRECAERTLANADVDMNEIDHIDFYSCFPVAVELACEAFGIAEDDPRGLTLTGGLPYAGGPGNNYTLHSLAALCERLRAHPGDKGLVTGNGWYLTKHSANLWCSEPRPEPPRAAEWIEAGPEPLTVAEAPSGSGVVETYTVVYARDGSPERGVVLGRCQEDGARFMANTPADRLLLEALVREELVGRTGRLEPAGDGRTLFLPD